MKQEEVIEKLTATIKIGTKIERTEGGFIDELIGDNQEIVGLAVAIRGDDCQQILWLKNDRFEDEGEEDD